MIIKKLIGAVLIGTAMLSLVACGNGTTDDASAQNQASVEQSSLEVKEEEQLAVEDMPVIKVALCGIYDMTDANMVVAKMNEILAERYKVQCDITFINAGSWVEQSNLLLTGDDVDIMTYFFSPLSTFVNNKQCLPLDDYVAGASDEFKQLFTEEQLKACQIGGVQYTIPNERSSGYMYGVNFNEEMLEGLGYKAEEITNLAEVEEVLRAAKEAYPDVYTLVPQTMSTFCSGWTWDGLGDSSWVGVLDDCGEASEVIDIFESEKFKELCTYTNRWYKDGLMMGDALTNQEDGMAMLNQGLAFACFGNRAVTATDVGVVFSAIIDEWTSSTAISWISFGINSLSNDPDNAWTLLEALYTDGDLQTLLIDGIEGVHYILNEDGSASYLEGVDNYTTTYGNAFAYWMMPYANGAPVMDIMGDVDFWNKIDESNRTTKISRANGFVLDTDSMGITDEYTACINVVTKYYDGLMNGVLDPETVMEQAHQEMLDAGIEKVIEAKQKVLDELLAN